MIQKKIAKIEVIKAGSNPDIDSDFNTICRDSVIEMITEKYGKENTANIITFNTLAAKGAFKAMCTIYEVPFAQANKITSLIPPDVEGEPCTIEDIYNPNSDRYSEAADFRTATSDDFWKPIIAGAKEISGRNKSVGVHPCGMVISSKKLAEVIPLHVRQKDGRVITQLSYKDLEELGLIKMDILGLDTVDLIQKTIEYIQKS
ncbi:MAG: DNA polymerase III subunit alpha, partial [Desulfitobacterium sp.]|nr:DNA polymerase III subunit alpha [Desulfitobacterium sp.]